MKFKHTDFDGCMYGLVSKRGGTDGLAVRKPWRIAFINSSIDKYLNLTCDGSYPHIPCNGPDVVYSQGYTPSICRAIMKSVQDGKTHSSLSVMRLLHVCISSECEAQINSACCHHSRHSPSPESSMASRRGPSQAKEDTAIVVARLASERARLQAVAEANRKKIAQQKRDREEAETAKAVAASSK